jgi:hypothetical protein
MTPPPKKRFFCFIQDKVEGPFNLVELAGLLRAKHLDADTPLCVEGTEEWIIFRDRPEYAFAQEIPSQVIDQHIQETASASESSWSPKKLLMFLWIMAPVFLYLLYRFARLYLAYHLTHDASSNPDSGSAGSP